MFYECNSELEKRLVDACTIIDTAKEQGNEAEVRVDVGAFTIYLKGPVSNYGYHLSGFFDPTQLRREEEAQEGTEDDLPFC